MVLRAQKILGVFVISFLLHTELPDLYTELPDLYTELPDLYTELPDLYTELPDLGPVQRSEHSERFVERLLRLLC